MKLVQQLMRRRLIVVTGKGGVGKTTLTAALGRILSALGRKTLLLEIDPRESLHQLFGTEPSGGAIVKITPKLGLQNLQPRAVVEGLVREKVPIRPIASRIINSPVFKQSVDGAPGLKEMAVLGYALRTVLGEYRHSADVVILDAPATGHGASMLAAPLDLAEAVSGGQLGEMSRQLADFIANPHECAVMLATLAEEMPVQETIELIALLRKRLGRPPEAVLVNGLYPPFPAKSPGRRTAEPPSLSLWRDRRAVNERELARLAEAWTGTMAELPLLPLTRGPALLDRMVATMETALP